MRLGVVLMGLGAHAAASAGALEWMLDAGVRPYALCGMQSAAWASALYLAGYDARGIKAAVMQAACLGRRLLPAQRSARKLLAGKTDALCTGRRLEKLLLAQLGERMMSCSPQQGVFLTKAARSGHTVVFSTRACPQNADAILTLQASLSFAARAAMARPPFLSAMDWMGAPLLPVDDADFACRLLLKMGVQRVLVIAPQNSIRHEPDALEQAAGLSGGLCGQTLSENAGILRVMLDDRCGALSLERIAECAQTGKNAAAQNMEAAFERLGMPLCRVLPFRKMV